MDPEKNSSSTEENNENKAPQEGATEVQSSEQEAPADALSRTPEELEQEEAAKADNDAAIQAGEDAEKKLSPIKRFFRKVNVYFLLFLLIIIVVGVIAVVNYLNSTKPPVLPDVANQNLSQEALRQLANTDTTVGDASQTLTIQGNAVIAGQTLMRGNLNVAGNIQTGGGITTPSITISGSANLAETQINNLQVATNAAIQGTTTLRDLSVSGASTFSGPITASEITTSKLVMSGNAILEIPNHISFTGSSPGIAPISGLGNGGSTSINGSDTSGTVNINTGNNPAPGCLAKITFKQAFSNNPHVIISPVGEGAGQTNYYVTRDKTSFTICSANAAPANKVFAFDYFITN